MRDALSPYVPALILPSGSNVEMVIAHHLLVLIQFTTTYNHPLLRYIRIALALPTAYFFWEYGFSAKWASEFAPRRARYSLMGMALIGANGIMKLVEICVVGFKNEPSDWPRWVSKKEKTKEGKRKIIPFTPTLSGRFVYAADLLSVRGSSWFPDRVWNYAPTSVADYTPPSRLPFLKSLLSISLQMYLALDILETVMFTREWDSRNPYPVTSLPVLQQLLYALCVCMTTALSISAPYAINTFNTMLLGAPPSAWPPMFDAPFSSTSLAEFWRDKWHTIFRRLFDRLSYGVMLFLPTHQLHSRLVKLTRGVVIFGLSTILHLCLMWALPTDELHPYASLFNLQALKFFLSQPLGLLLEFVLIFPATERMPVALKREIRRAFAWCWLLWGGRFWSDVWISRGLWDYEERFIVYSPVRGLLYGKWII